MDRSLILKYVVVTFVTLVMVALVAEGALRILSGNMTFYGTTIQLDEDYEYQNIPEIRAVRPLEDGKLNILETNSRGFAGKEYSMEKPDGTTRILVIGDSFVEGKSVMTEDMFTTVLESRLNSSGDFEVIPRGTSSWATENEVLYLREEGLKYSPDVVVIAFFANDIGDNMKKELLVMEDGVLVDNTPFEFTFLQHAQVKCRSASELCGFFRFKVLPLFTNDEQPDGYYWGINKDLVLSETTAETQEAIDETREILREFVSMSEDSGFRPVLLYVPMKEQVDEGDLMSTFDERGMDLGDADIDKTNRIVAEMSEELGLDLIDPTESLRKAAETERVFYEVDAHLNTHGNEVLAEYLEKEIFSGQAGI